ncbi:MAG: catalase [Anaerotignum sp.]|nr:catalase [Anaerotignum sp.]
MKIKEHFQTITYHRQLVMKYCFRVGLYWQGLTHDLSKYSPTEFLVGAKYYQGDRSPNNAEKEAKGYSSSWLHHKGRNKHHFEYWMDYTMPGTSDQLLEGVKMPVRYVVEMFMDRIAACKVYQKDAYTDASPLEYHERSKRVKQIMHPETIALIEKLMKMLAEEGEKKTFAYTRKIVMKDKRDRMKNSVRLLKELFGK